MVRPGTPTTFGPSHKTKKRKSHRYIAWLVKSVQKQIKLHTMYVYSGHEKNKAWCMYIPSTRWTYLHCGRLHCPDLKSRHTGRVSSNWNLTKTQLRSHSLPAERVCSCFAMCSCACCINFCLNLLCFFIVMNSSMVVCFQTRRWKSTKENKSMYFNANNSIVWRKTWNFLNAFSNVLVIGTSIPTISKMAKI